ncbi:MAG TPA: VWA domain-containing protein [Blastocatellia bacterium]|nr:VWA domain-containing protein [Blastocatellia bacterium]
MLHGSRFRFAIAIIVAVFILSQPASQFAQQPPPQQKQDAKQPGSQTPVREQDPPVRISTQLVQIDATVTDKKGEHVEDLSEDDFELTVDGKKQNITYFRLVKLPEPKAPEPAAANAPKSATPPPSAPMKTIAPERVARTVAFVVDDLGLSYESTYYARRAIKKFVDEQMQEGDLVGIIRTGRGLGALQQFTTDKRVLYAAIEKLTWNPYSRDMIPHFGTVDNDDMRSQEARDAEARFEDFRETVFSAGTLGALNFVIRGLRELPGRKSAILISDGFSLFGRNRDNNFILEQVRRLTDLANRSSVVIYSLDAKGLQTLFPTAADNIGNPTGPQFAERLSQMSQQNFDSQEGLTYLARETGGFAILNNNDLNSGIQRALKDQRSYYLLGFDPEDEKFDRKYHSIKLKVNRPGLQTRTRAGFIGYPDRPKETAPQTREAQILSALFSPFGARDVSMQMTSFFFNSPNPERKQKNDPENISFVRSFFHIDASNLTFKDAANGEKALKLEIATFTFNENGVVIEQHGRAFEMNLDDARYRLAMKKGFSYTDDFVIKKPGAYQFRAVIRDPETGRLGSAGQFIQVPDLSKNRLALSGLVLALMDKEAGQHTNKPDGAKPDGAKPDGAKPDGANPGEAKADGAKPDGAKAEERDDIQPTPGVRRFSRNSMIDYGAVVYNPTLDPKTGKPQLTTQLEFYRDGKVLLQLQPRPIDPGEAVNPKRLDCGGRLKLNGFPPGDYVMRLIVTDVLAKSKYSRAEQWMDFSVR